MEGLNMKTNWFKRILCSVLALVLVLGYVPVYATATESDGLCEHHTQHTTECGYSPAVEGHACNHEHTDECHQSVTECVHTHGDCGYVPAVEGHDCDCQPDENGEIVHTDGCGYVEAVAETPCGHICSEETGCVTKALNCQHQHNAACGYAEAAAETPCGFVCEECAKKEALKNGLQEIPVESVTITQEEELSEVLVGETLELTAVILPENATDKTVTWSSSDEAIATVDENGIVTGVSEGKSVISLSSKSIEYTYTVTVVTKTYMVEETATEEAVMVASLERSAILPYEDRSGLFFPVSKNANYIVTYSALSGDDIDKANKAYADYGTNVYSFHHGTEYYALDISGTEANAGAPVFAVADGVIVDWRPSYGQITVEHSGLTLLDGVTTYSTWYSTYVHMFTESEKAKLSDDKEAKGYTTVEQLLGSSPVGQHVSGGQRIGTVWATGTAAYHLHFSMTTEIHPVTKGSFHYRDHRNNADNSDSQILSYARKTLNPRWVFEISNNKGIIMGGENDNGKEDLTRFTRGTEYAPGTELNRKLFTSGKPNGVTISFNANGGTGSMAPITVSAGNVFTMPTCTFTKSGYECASWNLKRSDNTWLSYNGEFVDLDTANNTCGLYYFFSGCGHTPDESWFSDGEYTYTFYVNWKEKDQQGGTEAELRDALNSSGSKIVVDSFFSITSDLTIPSGKTVSIVNGAITVPEGITLTNNGEIMLGHSSNADKGILTIDGSFKNNGSTVLYSADLNQNGEMVNSGSVTFAEPSGIKHVGTLANSGSIQNNGCFRVMSENARIGSTGTFTQSGSGTFERVSTSYVAGISNQYVSLLAYVATENEISEYLQAGYKEINFEISDSITFTRDCTIPKNAGFRFGNFSNRVVLTVSAGVCLTIESENLFELSTDASFATINVEGELRCVGYPYLGPNGIINVSGRLVLNASAVLSGQVHILDDGVLENHGSITNFGEPCSLNLSDNAVLLNFGYIAGYDEQFNSSQVHVSGTEYSYDGVARITAAEATSALSFGSFSEDDISVIWQAGLTRPESGATPAITVSGYSGTWYILGYGNNGWELTNICYESSEELHTEIWERCYAVVVENDTQSEEIPEWIDTPVTLTEDTVVPEGTAVYIDSGGSVTVPAGIKLDIQGSVTIYDGSLTVEKGGSLTVCDNLKALSVWTGKLDVTGADISSVPCGSVEVQLNSSAEVIGIPDNMLYASIYVYDTADINTSLKLSDRYAWLDLLSDTSITLENNIDIPENTEFILWKSDPDSKTVQFVIPKDIRLVNYGYFSVYDDCRVVAEPGSTLHNSGYIYVSPFSSMLALGVFTQNGTVEGEILQKTGSQDNLEAILADCAQNNYGWIQENEVRLVRDLTIDLREKSFQISKYGSIIVSNGVTLTVNSTIDLFCSDPREGGTIIVENGGRLIINGTLTTDDDSKLTLKSGAYMQVNGSVFNNGGITLEKDSTLQLSGSWIGLPPRNNGGTILPHADSIQIQEQGGMIDLYSTDSILLHIQSSPDTAMKGVKWSSSNAMIVDPTKIVDNGMGEYCITFGKTLGSVTLTATAIDGSKKTDSITLNVIYLDGAKALTAVSDAPSMGLQPGQKAQISVSGMNPIAPENLDFTIPSTQNSIATVDDNGVVTAGNKPGTVTVTVSLKGDPLNRSASLQVKVIAPQAASLILLADGVEKEELAISISNSMQSIHLTASALDGTGNTFTPEVTWNSSNPAVAKVDDTGLLTIPAKATGQCVITATVNDPGRASAQLAVSVRDYSPRLASSSITLNSCSQRGVALDLRESYDNAIVSVELTDAPNGMWLDGDALTLYAEGVKNGTYYPQLLVSCEDGNRYSYKLQVKVANALPAVTVKQTEKFNLFYLDSAAALSITAAGQTITNVEIADTDDFTVAYSGGTATLRYAPNPATKPDTKATLLVYLEGYNTPASKFITISTVTTAPKLSLSPSASTINTALNDSRRVDLKVWNKTEGNWLIPDCVEYTAEFATIVYSGDTLTLTLDGDTGGTATIWVRQSNWAQAVKLTHKVAVSSKLPVIKLGSTKLTLNSYFTKQSAATPVTLSQGNLTLSNVALISTARAGSAAALEAGKLNVYYSHADGCIRAEIPDDAPKAGTYTYSVKGILSDGVTEISGGTLKVTVSAALPKVKLSASSVKLNKYLAGQETGTLTVSVPAGYTLEGFAGMDETLGVAGNVLTVQLTGNEAIGKRALSLYPILKDEATGQIVTLPTALKLTVQVYESSKLGMSLSAKGKLDTLHPDRAIVYTPKLTNCIGAIEDVSLDGQDADKFHAELEDGKIVLTLCDGKAYATNVTYKVQFRVSVCGQEVLSPVVSVKVTQSKVKFTAAPTVLTLYQSQRTPLTLRLTQSIGEIAEVSINDKTSPELIAALGEDGLYAEVDGSTAGLELTAGNAALLNAGKSYTLYLDITPKNNATNLKPAQVRLTVKVMK